MGQPDPMGAAATIRDVFGRMDWHGRELVALIGGGHTFGKSHGASMESKGVPPNECPFAAWKGPTGIHTITSGIEGPWTTTPTQWDNQYFTNLLNYEWEVKKGPGGHWQYYVKEDDRNTGPMAPTVDLQSQQEIIMLTTDIALKVDPEYRIYVEEFAKNQTALTEVFGRAWYKLVTRDMGPVTRCVGNVSF
jgi:catalase-peroxidase